MIHYQSAFSTLINELLEYPDLAHSDMFRKLPQAGLHDLFKVEVLGSGFAGVVVEDLRLLGEDLDDAGVRALYDAAARIAGMRAHSSSPVDRLLDQTA